MSDFFNPLNPRNDLSCPNIHVIMAEAFKRAGRTEEKTVDEAYAELARLYAVIQAQSEQMERTERAMVEYAARDKKHVDQLCDIRDTLKASMLDATDISCWVRRSDAIKSVLKKNFSLDLDK